MTTTIRIAVFFIFIANCSALERDTTRAANIRQDSVVQLASRYYSEGNYKETIALTDPLDSLSLSPHLLYYQGLSHAALNNYRGAIECLKKGISGDSANVNYRFQYGKLLIQAGFTEDAAAELAACIALDSTYLPASIHLGLLYNAQKENPLKEHEIFSFLLRQNPNDFVSLFYEGDALRRLNLPDSGIVFIERSIDVNPRYFPSLIASAHYRDVKEQYALALERYRSALAIRPHDKNLLLQLGECLRKTGANNEAAAYFKKAIAIDSSNAVVHAQLGYAYFSMGRFDSSIQSYKTAIALDPENVHYYQNLILAYQKTDSIDAVIACYQKVIEILHPENISYAYGNWANYLYSKNRTDSAVAAYHLSISEAYAGLAAFYNGKRMRREAIAAYQRVLEYNPRNVDVLTKIAMLSSDLHDTKAAILALEKWMRLTEKDSTHIFDRKYVKDQIDWLKKNR